MDDFADVFEGCHLYEKFASKLEWFFGFVNSISRAFGVTVRFQKIIIRMLLFVDEIKFEKKCKILIFFLLDFVKKKKYNNMK